MQIRVGVPDLEKNRHIVIGVYDLFKNLLEHNGSVVKFFEVDELNSEALDYFLSFGYGINQKIVKERGSGIRYISIWDDLHYHTEESRTSRFQYFGTADKLLLTYQKAFLEMDEYEDFQHKSQWFPWWVPNEFAEGSKEIGFENRERSVLLTGRISDSYPLRQHVFSMTDSIDGLAIHAHPGYGMRKTPHTFDFTEIHESYIERLRSCQCALQIGAKAPLDKYQLAKYFEIPAAGCVLVATGAPFLNELGFVPEENYIEIDENELLNGLDEVIPRILEREDLGEIARAGWELVSQRHCTGNRVESIIEIIAKDYYDNNEFLDEELFYHHFR